MFWRKERDIIQETKLRNTPNLHEMTKRGQTINNAEEYAIISYEFRAVSTYMYNMF